MYGYILQPKQLQFRTITVRGTQMTRRFYDFKEASNIYWCHIHNSLLYDLVSLVAVLLVVFRAKHFPQIGFEKSARQTSGTHGF